MAGPDFKNGYKKGFEDGANSVEEGLPGWFGTFADMMTLLFAFFVLLAAISTMDPVKLQEMANSEGKSLGSKIKASGKAEEEGEFEPIKNLAAMKKEMEETIEEMKKENPKGDPPIDIQTSSKGLIVNIKGDYAFPIGKASMKEELKGLLDEEIIPKIAASPFQVEVAGHSDSDIGRSPPGPLPRSPDAGRPCERAPCVAWISPRTGTCPERGSPRASDHRPRVRPGTPGLASGPGTRWRGQALHFREFQQPGECSCPRARSP